MENSGIIPLCIDVIPPKTLNVVFENTNPMTYGVELTPTQVKNEPTVTWDADPAKYYFLVEVDPDAPSKENPIYSPINHWMVGNIPGNDVSSSDADVMIEYRGSLPPKGSGLHRYVFLLYEQKGKLDFKDAPRSHKLSRENRFKFQLKDFLKNYNLGNPIAGNYYEAQWDSYVDEKYKQMENQ